MIRNFTPHTINVILPDGQQIAYPSEGVARCVTIPRLVGDVEGIPLVVNEFGPVEGLPPENGDDYFLVSFLVLQACAGVRSDLIGPDTTPAGNPVRNADGQIVAVRRFQTM